MHNEKARRDRDATSNSHLLVDEEQGRWACYLLQVGEEAIQSMVACCKSARRDPVAGGLLQVGDEEIRSWRLAGWVRVPMRGPARGKRRWGTAARVHDGRRSCRKAAPTV
jgi:hypothetical protein